MAIDARGLTTAEAHTRRRTMGENRLPPPASRHALHILASQLASPLVLVLVAAALIARMLGEAIEANVILAIIALNAALGFLQEYRAERALRALQAFVSRTARVLRDGVLQELPADGLVPDDVIALELGDLVPADVELLTSVECAVDASSLTGESEPVARTVGDPVLMGSFVVSGEATARVTATGARSVLGRSAGVLEQPTEPSDFQRNIRRFSSFLVRLILLLTVFVFAVNAVLGKGWFDSFLFALALAVGITPEILPVIVTIALARGARRMARQEVVVKRLMTVEDLGNMDILCCDKTGTLTEGVFALHDTFDAAGQPSDAVYELGALAAAAGLGTPDGPAGNAMDRAMWVSPRLDRVRSRLAAARIVGRAPFDFTRRRSSVVVETPEGCLVIVKGAVEHVLAVCVGHDLDQARTIGAALEQQGYRVLAIATRRVDLPRVDDPRVASSASAEVDVTLQGFLCFSDPPKVEARAALDRLEALGVTITIISGDSTSVTRRVCDEVGVPMPDDRVMSGEELARIDDTALRDIVTRCRVFSRVPPDGKARIVAALRGKGQVVGFLGDGVNDGPALRAADAGIAVDTGADVAKAAADIVLLRKSLGVLADGILEGRRTFANITKYILNTVSANFGNMSTVAISSLFLRFIPLLPSQILLNNFLSDLPLVAISSDRVDERLTRRPRHWDLHAIGRFMLVFGALSAVFDLALILPMLLILHTEVGAFRTAWFVESACSELIVTFAIRTQQPFFRSRPSTLLWTGSAAAVLLAFALPYLPVAQRLFGLVPLPARLTGFVMLVLAGYFISAEYAKRWYFARLT